MEKFIMTILIIKDSLQISNTNSYRKWRTIYWFLFNGSKMTEFVKIIRSGSKYHDAYVKVKSM